MYKETAGEREKRKKLTIKRALRDRVEREQSKGRQKDTEISIGKKNNIYKSNKKEREKTVREDRYLEETRITSTKNNVSK